MSSRVDAMLEFLRRAIAEPLGRLIGAAAWGIRACCVMAYRRRWRVGISRKLA